MEQQSHQQRRRNLIQQLLFFKHAKEMEGDTQKLSISDSQKQIQNAVLEAQIKQFDCQQIQNYPDIQLQRNFLCRYNPIKKAQILCCSEYCDNHAIMCGEQTCKCALDHYKCTFVQIESFIHQIVRKILQSIPKQIELYFQVKSVIYEHMANRISQERQALMDWQGDIQNDSALILYVSNLDQAIACHAPKIKYQKIHSNHQKCCIPLQIRKSEINENKQQIVKTICQKIHKKYSSIIEYLDQKVDQLQYHKKYANLNSAELIFINFWKNMNTFKEQSKPKDLDLDEGLKEMKIVPGHIIYLARKYNQMKLKNLDQEKFSVNRIKIIWKGYSENIFRSFVEGKVINELFCQMEKLALLKVHSLQDIKSQIDRIIQSISQGQEYLFSKSILTKKLVFTNLQEKQIYTKLKQFKGKKVNEYQIKNNRQKVVKYREVKFDQVCISNDRVQTALNNIGTIKELHNLRSVTKLEIKWCQQMKAQVSMEILNTMPHLKHLALLHHLQKLCQNFIKKLCQFKQLKFFYIHCNSHPKYHTSFQQDRWFIQLLDLNKDNLPLIKELVELTKVPKLENIEISLVNDANSAQVLINMKSLRHLALGFNQFTDDVVDADLMKQLCKKKTLITLSLIGLKVQSKQVDHIIKSNPYLKTIIIRNFHDNKNINDETVECMANLVELQNLCVMKNTAITGKHLSKLDKLIMLEVYDCKNINKKQIKEAITKMHKLEFLKINGNQWFNDEVLANIQSCKQLTYLNIEFTQILCGLKHLQGLTLLNILICGYTKINGKNLIELTKYTPAITRLDIKQLEVDDNELLQICANCQKLTHLGIYDKNIKAETLLKIKQLKVIRTNFGQNCNNKLRQTGIQVYQ